MAVVCVLSLNTNHGIDQVQSATFYQNVLF